MPTILDFQIQSLSAESYSLTVCERGSSQPLASATFSHRVDFLTDFSVDRLNASTQDAGDRFYAMKDLGAQLYQKLFPPAVDSNSQFERIMTGKVAQPAEVAPFSQVVDRESNATSAGCATVFGQIENCCSVEQVWREYKQRSEFLILCLRFAEGAAKLEVLPWETLYDKDNEEFIAAGHKTTLTRLPLDVAPPGELPPIPRPLKLFGFFASPLDLGDHERLNAEREQEILLEAINDPAAQGRISADFEDEAKLEILERSLKDGYHILHFTGHGISPRDGGGLLLEDAHGKKLPASIAAVMQAIPCGQDGNAKLRLAVISGCQTARTLHTGAFNDLARELLRQRVPAVIAMQFSITDEGGLKFAEVLYREIAKGVELERAVHAARRVLLADERFFINNDALAIVLLAADGACLQTTETEAAPPQAEPGATYLGDRLDPLAHGFYGRRREYRKIRDALLHQDQRAVIIHGIGGIGKTALLTHAINRLRPRFKDVMSFDCRRAALAPETILLELHRYFATQGMPQLQTLIGQNVPPETLADEIAQVLMLLTERPLLIVFDNFESQLDERRAFLNDDLRVFLTTLVRATATGSRFLFTTRYLFDLDGERLSNVHELPLGDLSRAEALMLMQKLPNLAQAAHRDKLTALEKFGGHPYALLTLDRHCSHQPLDQALQDADSLKSELREFLAIELNYRRLSERARELLNRLAAFHRSVPPAAAEWVMSEKVSHGAETLQRLNRDEMPEWKSLDDAAVIERLNLLFPPDRRPINIEQQLFELIKWGLLTPTTEDGELRTFTVHAITREFCRNQLRQDAWCAYLRDAGAFYTHSTKMVEPDDKTPSEVWVEMEAFELLMEAKNIADATVFLGEAHASLARWGYLRYLERQYQRLLGFLDREDEGKALHNLGTLLSDCGEYDKAFRYFQRSLEIVEPLGDREGIAGSLHQIGLIHQHRGEYEKAFDCYQHAMEMFEALGNQEGIAVALHQIGIIHQIRGEYGKALDHFHRSLNIQVRLFNRAGVAHSWNQIGMVHQDQAEYDEALICYHHSLEIGESLGDRLSMANVQGQIGIIHHDRREYDKALEHYQHALVAFEALDNREGIAGTLDNIGGIYYDRGEYGKALEYYQRAMEIFEAIGNSLGVALSSGHIGALLMEKFERYQEAFAPLVNALFIFVELQSPSAEIAVNALKELRRRWSVRQFDIAWQQTTGEEVPDWLKEPLGLRLLGKFLKTLVK